jgi:hypothetical protein
MMITEAIPMIQNASILHSFENTLTRREPADHRRSLLIFEALYCEARTLGIIPLQNPLEGIEVDIRLAGVLNDRGAAPSNRSRAE